MTTYIKPNVLVYEEKVSTAAAGETAQRPWIVGQNTQIHDRSDSVVCDYADDVPTAGLTKSLPDLSAGSVIDESSVKVYADEALLQYAEVEAKDSPDDDDVVAYNYPATPNVVTFRNLNIQTNANHSRNAIFGNRDVEVGDQVILSAYAASIPGVTQCENVEFKTKVLDILVDMEAGEVGKVVRKTNKNNVTLTSAVDNAIVLQNVKQDSTVVTGATGTYSGSLTSESYTLTIKTVDTANHTLTYTTVSTSGTDSNTTELTSTGTQNATDTTKYDYTFNLGKVGSTVKLAAFTEPSADTAYTVTFGKTTLSNATGTYSGTLASEVYTLAITSVDTTNHKVAYTVTSASGLDSYPEIASATGTQNTSETSKYDYTFSLGRYGSTIKLTAITESTGSYTITFDSAAFTGKTYVSTGTSTVQPTRIHTDIYSCSKELKFDGIYDAIESGYINQDFSFKVVAKHNTASCKNIELSIVSASGLQDSYGVQALSEDGTNYTFKVTEDLEAGISATDFESIEVGDSWCYRLEGAYTPATVTASGYFTGAEDDTYVITCVNGGTVGGTDKPQITVRLLGGAEFIGPITVSGTQVTTAYGVTFTFSSNQIALGETWLCKVESEQNGPATTMELADSLPTTLRTLTASNPIYLNVKFCIQRDVEITGTTGLTVSDKKITVPANLKIKQDDILTTAGAQRELTLLDAKITVAYNEWLASKGGKFNYINSVDDLDTIPGPLVPENQLKYGVYKALANANGETIVYTAVVGNDMDAWSAALNVGANSREVYSVVPLTQSITIQNYAVALINSDSGEETCSWKNCYLNTVAPTEIIRVGKDTSYDGKYVYATISTEGVVEITSKYKGKANIDLSGVVAGDELRVLTGTNSYTSYIVDEVSGDTMKILNPPTQAIDVGIGIEVWHSFTRDEQVDYIADVAQSFANRRVILVWPDVVGEGAYSLPGTFLCAALAGLAAGSLPNQGLTRVSLSGFDDLTRSSEYFTETQLNKLAGSGVWVVTEDKDGTVFTRHAVTTSTTDIQEKEEMFTRVLDYIAFQLHDILDTYIGTTNVTDRTITSIECSIDKFMRSASNSSYNAMGSLITEYEIQSVSQDDLLKDRINVVVALTIVKAVNNIVLRIQAS